MAMGAYDAVRKLNLSIPDEVAIVGFDNHEIIAAHLHPGLTTMQLPHYEMGRWAVAHLLDLIQETDEGAKASAEQALLHCPLIERISA
jgi:LacI family transcriptional regulator